VPSGVPGPGPQASAAPATVPAAPQVALDLQFGDAVKLKGYTLGKAPDGKTELMLFWECLAPVADDYAVFVHLFPGERSVLPSDRQKLGYLNLDNRPATATSRWEAGKTYVSKHRGVVPSGKYRTAVGLYSMRTGKRMQPAGEAAGAPEPQSVLLGEIAVE
jgi:hypothetical protein